MSLRFLSVVPDGTQAELRGGNVGCNKRETVKTAQWWITQSRFMPSPAHLYPPPVYRTVMQLFSEAAGHYFLLHILEYRIEKQ